ncbi:unnamed protein product [Mytilus edulis]|uniref:Integrase catalytic domain-containing protein n=1 Tax=Mytilus edulis TaxID=6550 RepID=A0A8S3RJG6_MYTED|nr:unnamed protein product [Mytilus edulis]
MASWEKYLRNIYYNPANPASFAGPDKLYRFVRTDGKFVLSKYKIRKWLQRQEPYSLQRPLKRSFKRNRVIVIGIDDQWDIDLMDMSKFSKFNSGFNFILVVIDIFSKYVWLRPLKNKKGESVANALKHVLSEGRSPNRIRTDKGQEFRSRLVESLLKQRTIQHLFAQNTEIKANYVERVIKTIKSKIMRFITSKQSYDYVDNLQNFANSYNKTFHRTIGMAPDKVTISKETNLWWKMYWPKRLQPKTEKVRKPFRFKIGDKVRITYMRNPFTREYDEKWSGEIFKISQRILRGGLPVYRLIDFQDEEISGTFYQSEVQKVDVREDDMWKVEKILKTKGKGPNKQYYVKWLHWPKKFNSWIKARDFSNI